MSKNWEDDAWEEYVAWQNEDKKTLKKINVLLKDIERNGAAKGIGKPEPLKNNYAGYWSRRIDEKNRLIYKVDEDANIRVFSCKGHYE